MHDLKNELAVYAIAVNYNSVNPRLIAGTGHKHGGLVSLGGVIIMV